jgi:arginine repressor
MRLSEESRPFVAGLLSSGWSVAQILIALRNNDIKTSKSSLNRFVNQHGLRKITSKTGGTFDFLSLDILEPYMHWLQSKLLDNTHTEEILYLLERDFGIVVSKSSLQRFFNEHRMMRAVEISRDDLIYFLYNDQKEQGWQQGYKMVCARLRSVFGIPVKQKAVMDIMRELNPEANLRRLTEKFVRRFLFHHL